MRLVSLLVIIVLLLGLVGSVQAENEIIAPNVFLNGLQLADGVRYTASFVKPTDDLALRNISVEITLPVSAFFKDMLVSQQVQFNVVRINQQGALTLIWQISRVPADKPLDHFSFTLAQPLTEEMEFYIEWETETGEVGFENFFQLPPVIVADQSEGQIVLFEEGYTLVEGMGIQAATDPANFPLIVSLNILAENFNPPAEYGDTWWCSILQLNGAPVSAPVDVIVPLRRPVAPFTSLQMFQQQADGSWLPLNTPAIVTADGLFVMYTHPGGVIATGGEKDIQAEIVDAVQLEIPVPTPPGNPPPTDTKGEAEIQFIESQIASVQGTEAPPPAENSGEAPPPAEETVIIVGEQPANDRPQNAGELREEQANNQPNPSSPSAAPAEQETNRADQQGNQAAAPGENTTANRPDQPTGSQPVAPEPQENIAAEKAEQELQQLGIIQDDEAEEANAAEDSAPVEDNKVDPSNPILTPQPENSGGNQLQNPNAGENLAPTEPPTITIIEEEREGSNDFGGNITPEPPREDASDFASDFTPEPPVEDNKDEGIREELEAVEEQLQEANANAGANGESTEPPTITIIEEEEPETLVDFIPGFPNVAVNPPAKEEEEPSNAKPFGEGGTRIEIFTPDNDTVIQCQLGQIICSLIERRLGEGFRP